MAWTTPKTWGSEPLTADKLNEQLRDNLNALKDPATSSVIANTVLYFLNNKPRV